ncbi:MAG: type II toxin-antitoxin system prevent-host-death family antitoxin [bacterium]|nr:type II toxin-antitoxin system prevent-host-death family antitoxin [bacterium]
MRTIGSYEAKTHLPRLLEEVQQGEAIIISKHGVPVAMLVPVPESRRRNPGRVIGALRTFRKGITLRPLLLRDLIEEGRR